jgi:hypothetical protein
MVEEKTTQQLIEQHIKNESDIKQDSEMRLAAEDMTKFPRQRHGEARTFTLSPQLKQDREKTQQQIQTANVENSAILDVAQRYKDTATLKTALAKETATPEITTPEPPEPVQSVVEPITVKPEPPAPPKESNSLIKRKIDSEEAKRRVQGFDQSSEDTQSVSAGYKKRNTELQIGNRAYAHTDDEMQQDLERQSWAYKNRPYKVLDLPHDATAEQITQKKTQLAEQYKDEPNKLQEVEDSYKILTEQRKTYDDHYNNVVKLKKLEMFDRRIQKASPSTYTHEVQKAEQVRRQSLLSRDNLRVGRELNTAYQNLNTENAALKKRQDERAAYLSQVEKKRDEFEALLDKQIRLQSLEANHPDRLRSEQAIQKFAEEMTAHEITDLVSPKGHTIRVRREEDPTTHKLVTRWDVSTGPDIENTRRLMELTALLAQNQKR